LILGKFHNKSIVRVELKKKRGAEEPNLRCKPEVFRPKELGRRFHRTSNDVPSKLQNTTLSVNLTELSLNMH
jgi:hypothetical protein